MTEKDLKILFEQGVLVSIALVSNPMSAGMNLEVSTKNGKQYAISSKREDRRVFKSYEAAFKVAKSIGFKNINCIIL
jgi:hypothetical protein